MNYHFTDTLYDFDAKRHIPHLFAVPAGCQRIHIRLHFAPALVHDIRNMLTLTLFDPTGFRGAGHRGGSTHEVELTDTQATPGYLSGPLPAGAWTAQIDTHMILPGEPCHYELDVTCEPSCDPPSSDTEATPPPARAPVRPLPIRTTAGWYRGDIHSHTLHSDASWTVEKLAANARAHHLDFITLTDHNTISPLSDFAQQTGPDLLTMGGIELTTFWGHALCLGRQEWIDWRVDTQGNGMAHIAAATYASGGIFIIAHPLDIGDPWCTGCRWLYPEMMPGNARFVEIWNHEWRNDHKRNHAKNEDGLALWYQWLNAGYRLHCTAGSDTHGPNGYLGGVGFNVIYAEELSERALLDGIRAGHLYLSAGPSLRFAAQTAHGHAAMMGDTLPVRDIGQPVTLIGECSDLPDHANLRLIVNGQLHSQESMVGSGTQHWKLPLRPGDWTLLELRAADGTMAAITNPIFIEQG